MRYEIAWPAGVSIPVLAGQSVLTHPDGSLTISYTPDELRAVLTMMKSMRGQRWTAADTAAFDRVIPEPTLTPAEQRSLL